MSGAPFMDQTPEVFLVDLEAFLGQEPGIDTHQDTQLILSGIPGRLIDILQKGDEETYLKALEIIGTAFGQKKQWHSPLWKGFLEYAAQALTQFTVQRTKQYLRIIGNLVADNDANRELATPYLKAIASCLEADELRTTALAVMLNLCNDYEPAQIEAANIRLDATLANSLAADKIPEGAIEHATDLLSWTTDKLTPEQMRDHMSVVVFENILTTALQYDEESYFDYLAICTHYLQDPEFQLRLTSPQLIEKIVDLLLNYESRLTPGEINDSFQALRAKVSSPIEIPDDTTILLMVQLVNALSGISSSDAFIKAFDLQSPLLDKLRSRLQQAPYGPSAVCACVILGNLATCDETTIAMAKDTELLENLLSILDEQDKPALLFAAAGLIRHLAFPEANRTILGEAGFIEKICVLISSHDPSVRGEAAAILVKLVSNNEHNIKKLFRRKPDNAVSDLHKDVIMLWFLTDQALLPSAPLPSTSMKNAGIEIGKMLVAVLRWLRRAEQTEEVRDMIERFFVVPPVGRPIARLLRQRFYADVRSEGLLGMGLMAQDADGADCVVSEMKNDGGLLEAVREFAVEQRKNDKDAGRDFQNAVVMLHGVLKFPPTDMGDDLKKKVEEVQKELSKLMV